MLLGLLESFVSID